MCTTVSGFSIGLTGPLGWVTAGASRRPEQTKPVPWGLRAPKSRPPVPLRSQTRAQPCKSQSMQRPARCRAPPAPPAGPRPGSTGHSLVLPLFLPSSLGPAPAGVSEQAPCPPPGAAHACPSGFIVCTQGDAVIKSLLVRKKEGQPFVWGKMLVEPDPAEHWGAGSTDTGTGTPKRHRGQTSRRTDLNWERRKTGSKDNCQLQGWSRRARRGEPCSGTIPRDPLSQAPPGRPAEAGSSSRTRENLLISAYSIDRVCTLQDRSAQAGEEARGPEIF